MAKLVHAGDSKSLPSLALGSNPSGGTKQLGGGWFIWEWTTGWTLDGHHPAAETKEEAL